MVNVVKIVDVGAPESTSRLAHVAKTRTTAKLWSSLGDRKQARDIFMTLYISSTTLSACWRAKPAAAQHGHIDTFTTTS